MFSARPRFLYWLFALALIPVAVSLLAGSDDVEQRLMRTVEAHPELFGDVDLAAGDELPDEREFFAVLPGGKIEGAHLSRRTWMPWFYALLAAAAFLAAGWFLFETGNATGRQMLLVGLYAATIGLVLLFFFQLIAALTQGIVVVGFGIAVVLFYVVQFIGFSYRAAADPEMGFMLSFVGFTFGVGLCEELTKVLPLLFHYRAKGSLDWRGACIWGLAGGIGFGVAEGIIYSYDFYNGVATAGDYVVRFVSCVGLHSVWAAAAAIMIWRRREWVEADADWGDFLATVIWVLAVPMVLHGLYDTFLKKEMTVLALAAALGSFAWLIFITESTRRKEAEFYEAEKRKLRVRLLTRT